jgi:hypothetical protein
MGYNVDRKRRSPPVNGWPGYIYFFVKVIQKSNLTFAKACRLLFCVYKLNDEKNDGLYKPHHHHYDGFNRNAHKLILLLPDSLPGFYVIRGFRPSVKGQPFTIWRTP